ncbi:hypothetical protein [Nostoc sp. UHCC 0252]|uniref:hypothetical protein n=1 Tax=Nostoc sp. UHCC 0252 TaxID=3110241 RepID=UPI002B1FC3AE|nr:hypothetical protein [Nostoc sp. UHCC 0252]MEA5603298.1 hypothetical protein [Nostoc sp. UHCC 0252]
MDNLDANSKSTQPETQNTGGNKPKPKPTPDPETKNPGDPGTKNPGTNDQPPVASNSAFVSSTRPEDSGTHNPNDPGRA